MFEGIKSLLSSEKALAAGFLAISSTVFVLVGKMPVDVWVEYTQVLLGIYVGGKTVQGLGAAYVASKGPGTIANWSLGGGKSPADPPTLTRDDNTKFPT